MYHFHTHKKKLTLLKLFFPKTSFFIKKKTPKLKIQDKKNFQNHIWTFYMIAIYLFDIIIKKPHSFKIEFIFVVSVYILHLILLALWLQEVSSETWMRKSFCSLEFWSLLAQIGIWIFFKKCNSVFKELPSETRLRLCSIQSGVVFIVFWYKTFILLLLWNSFWNKSLNPWGFRAKVLSVVNYFGFIAIKWTGKSVSNIQICMITIRSSLSGLCIRV